jgi:hypothetical protein
MSLTDNQTPGGNMQKIQVVLLSLVAVTSITFALNMWSTIAALLFVGITCGLLAINEAVDR